MPKYQCVQFGICEKANACEEFEIKPGEAFVCPRSDTKCREQLVEIGTRKFPVAPVSIGIAAVLALSGGTWLLWPKPKPKPTVEQLLVEVWPWLK